MNDSRRNAPRLANILAASQRGIFLLRIEAPYHRQDAAPKGFGQIRPGIHDLCEIGWKLTGFMADCAGFCAACRRSMLFSAEIRGVF